MAFKWDKKPWKRNTEKWKDKSNKALSKTSYGNSEQEKYPIVPDGKGVIYIISETANSDLIGTEHFDKIGQGIIKIYKANGIAWLSYYKVILDLGEKEKILNSLTPLDAVLIYTDDKSLGYQNDSTMATINNSFSDGLTHGFFISFVYVGSNYEITNSDLYRLIYSGAHEILHQLVSRIGYIIYGNKNYFQPSYSDNSSNPDDYHYIIDGIGGLLAPASYYNSDKDISQPAKRGTSIEKIPMEYILDLQGFPSIVKLLKKLIKQKVQLHSIKRFEIMLSDKYSYVGVSDDTQKTLIINSSDQSSNSILDE